MTDFARSYRRYRHIINHTGGVSFDPRQLRTLYGIPDNIDGTGQTISVLELGGGFVQADLDQYIQELWGMPAPHVEFAPVLGATNDPTTPDSADGEVMGDLCVIAGMLPKARLICRMAPNTDAGFVALVNAAAVARDSVMSQSWGGSEKSWPVPSVNAMTVAYNLGASNGVTYTAASGDNGSSDGMPGNNVDFPASSPHVLSVGGITLITDGLAKAETVWNSGSTGGATGGGISSLFNIPTWQSGFNVPGGMKRGVPDVAGIADPGTGVRVRVDGQNIVIGGTSMAAPFWAAIIAGLNQALGKRLGFVNPVLYGLPASCFNDILPPGNNGTYIARPGYDCCTGRGTPFFAKILAALRGTPPPPPPPPPPPTTKPQMTVNMPLEAGTYVLTKQ